MAPRLLSFANSYYTKLTGAWRVPNGTVGTNTKCWFPLNFQNIIRRSPQASPTKNWKIKSAVKEKIRDLSSSSKNFERDTYKGGRGTEGAPPPFVGILSHKLFRLVLKSRICSLTADLIFQFFVGEAWGERRIMFWKFKGNQDVCELF